MALFKTKAQEEVERLIAENDELRNNLHAILAKHKDNTKLDAKIIEARKELTTLNKQNDEIKTDISKLQDRKSHLNDEARNFEAHILSLKSKEKDAYQLIANIKKDLEILEQEKNKKREIDIQSSSEINIKKSEINELNKIIESLEGVRVEVKDLEDKVKLLNVEEEMRIKHLDNIVDQTKKNEVIKQELDASIGKLILRIDESHDQLNENITKNSRIITELQESESEIIKFRKDIESLKETHGRLSGENTILQDEKVKLGEDIKRFEALRSEINDEILRKRNTDDLLTKQLDDLKEQINLLEKLKFEIEDTNISIEKVLASTLQKFNEEINTSNDKIGYLKKEILEKDKTVREKDQLLAEKSANIAEYGALNKVLQKEKSTVESSISELNLERKELFDMINVQKENQLIQKKYTSELKLETEQLEKRRAELEHDLKELLIQVSGNYSRSEENKTKISEEVSIKIKELNRTNDEIEEAKDELRRIKNECKQSELQKEEYTSKVSELIAFEKKIKQKIVDNESAAEHNSDKSLGNKIRDLIVNKNDKKSATK